MNCYVWELQAILEGLALRELDRQEQRAIFGFSLRYILNAKKPKLSKIIDKAKMELKIRNQFSGMKPQPKSKTKRVIDALNHFKNRKNLT